MIRMLRRRAILFSLLLALGCTAARAEDGYKLWLRYAPPADASQRAAYDRSVRQVVVQAASPIPEELATALESILGRAVPSANSPTDDGALLIGTPESSPLIAALNWGDELKSLGLEGYCIRTATVSGHACTVIASQGNTGALYGTFHFLRLLQTGQPIEALKISQHPRLQRRILDHWDNLDGSIERGYAGKSLWHWDDLPDKLDPRYKDYARANASIGVNGTVLNNVNANPKFLQADYLAKVAALANVFRPYGIRVYLSANFNAPRSLGKLPTADPLDPAVIAWWKAKADEIYRIIPDFGGFLVKANSEGQPGPQGYGRTHADGANVLADALAPHGGIVMWRAFVYEESVDPDRAKRAYAEFAPLDGKFRPNVILQVKNGPIDFQPREPFHPLFGATPRTPLMAELQIAPEYFGKHRHLVFFAPMWKEFLDADTFATGPGSTVARVLEGSVHEYRLTGIAGVANTGSDRNWTGHDLSQANWYAFGRLAWDPSLPAEQIADEWLRMTFSQDPKALDVLRPLMLSSWETYVSYNAPLGLTHLQADARDGPDPGSTRLPRADWNPPYYHRADATGLGFDRTSTGSNAVAQYFPPVRDQFADLRTCPEKFLLWFHHVPWTHKMASGRPLWDELCWRYNDGCERAAAMQSQWLSLKGTIDPDRFQAVADRLALQVADARRWRDRAVKYFQSVSHQPPPAYLSTGEADRIKN